MSDDNTYYQRDPRFTFGSGLLLVIFVGAVLFVAVMAYSIAPWEGDEPDANETVAAEATEDPEPTAGAGEEVTENLDEAP